MQHLKLLHVVKSIDSRTGSKVMTVDYNYFHQYDTETAKYAFQPTNPMQPELTI
jgi:hypothetical protein